MTTRLFRIFYKIKQYSFFSSIFVKLIIIPISRTLYTNLTGETRKLFWRFLIFKGYSHEVMTEQGISTCESRQRCNFDCCLISLWLVGSNQLRFGKPFFEGGDKFSSKFVSLILGNFEWHYFSQKITFSHLRQN